MLPGATEESIAQVEQNLNAVKSKVRSLDPGRIFLGEQAMSPYELVEELLEGLGVGVAEETTPAYLCTCNRNKVFRAIGLLKREEIEDILDKGEDIVAKCEFCGESYSLTPGEVADFVGKGGQ
jgi:molecular chaperone Hsp33